MNGLVLGLDIGIASVGVGILEKDTGKIIHASSRLFPAATADNNVERRSNRQGRRLNRRKKHRSVRLQDLFESYGLLTDFLSCLLILILINFVYKEWRINSQTKSCLLH